MKHYVFYKDYSEYIPFDESCDTQKKEFDSFEEAIQWVERMEPSAYIDVIFGPLVLAERKKETRPKTASEFLRFQNNGIWDQIRALNEIVGTISQQISRCSDAVYQYEQTLRFIANNSTDPVAQANAQSALDDYLVS